MASDAIVRNMMAIMLDVLKEGGYRRQPISLNWIRTVGSISDGLEFFEYFFLSSFANVRCQHLLKFLLIVNEKHRRAIGIGTLFQIKFMNNLVLKVTFQDYMLHMDQQNSDKLHKDSNYTLKQVKPAAS